MEGSYDSLNGSVSIQRDTESYWIIFKFLTNDADTQSLMLYIDYYTYEIFV